MSRSGSFSNFWRILSRASRLIIAYSGHTPGVLLLSFQDLRAVAIIQGRLSGKGGRMSGKRPVIQCLPVAPVPITRVLYSPRTHFTA